MHINRQKLLEITLRQLRRQSRRWGGIDLPFVEYLTREIIMLNPVDDCEIHGNMSDWAVLPKEKSLFYSEDGCGLPIGNLTSQLFSNVYLNELDLFMKRTLHCRHYGRYVDDFYVVSADREWLHSLIPHVRNFLQAELALRLHEGKLRICNVRSGVELLGAYLKPHRRYICTTSLRRIKRKLPSLAFEHRPKRLLARINSFLGILGHYRSWHIQMQMVANMPHALSFGSFVIKRTHLVFRMLIRNAT